jgi:hypothetical protein
LQIPWIFVKKCQGFHIIRASSTTEDPNKWKWGNCEWQVILASKGEGGGIPPPWCVNP